MSLFGVILVLIFPYLYWIWSECGKMRTRITPNTDTFCAVQIKCVQLNFYKYTFFYYFDFSPLFKFIIYTGTLCRFSFLLLHLSFHLDSLHRHTYSSHSPHLPPHCHPISCILLISLPTSIFWLLQIAFWVCNL